MRSSTDQSPVDSGTRDPGDVGAGEALWETTQRLTYHVENSPLAVIEWDRELRVTRWSSRAEAAFGWQAEEVMGKRLFDIPLVFEEDLPALERITSDLLSGTRHSIARNRNRTRDGRALYFEWYNSVLLDEAGSLVSVLSLGQDITENVRAQEALEASKERNRTILESANAIIYTLSLTGKFLYVSSNWTRWLGHPVEEVMGSPIDAFIFGDDMPSARAYMAAVLDRGNCDEVVEYRVRHRDGTLRWHSSTGSLVRDDAGRPHYFVGVATDVTERKRMEEALQRAVSLLSSTLNATVDGILVVDRVGKIVSFNEKFVRMWGLSEKDLAVRDDREVMKRMLARINDPGRFIARVREIDGQPEAHSFDTIELTDGRVLERYSQPQWLNGEAIGRVLCFRDITVRVQAQAAMQRQQELLRTVIDTVPSMIFVKDADGRFLLVNQAVADAYGTTVEYLIGKTDSDVNPDAEQVARYREADREVLASGQERFISEENVTDAAGNLRWLQTVKRPIRLPGDERLHVLGIATDITERRRMEAQLIHTEKLASMGKLVAGVAHEINNPLAAISGTAQILQMFPDPGVQQDAEGIQRMCDRVARIVRSLLSFAREQTGERAPLSVSEVIDDALEMMQFRMTRDDIDVARDFADDLPHVSANEGEILQVLVNLIANATHALQDKPRDERRISLRTRCERSAVHGDRVRIQVIDNGCGIPSEIRKHIFDPFFTTKTAGEGTGLGLSISYGIARAHGGDLTVESKPGAGSTFTLTLPATAD